VPERDDHAHTGQGRQFVHQVLVTVRDLGRRGAIRRGRTPDRRGDVGVDQPQRVAGVPGDRLIGEAGAVHRPHEEIAGAADAVARKDAAGPIRAVRGGRQPEHEDPRTRIAEPRDRAAPVGVLSKRRALLPRDPLAVLAQPRTAVAGDDAAVNGEQSGDWGLGTPAFAKATAGSPKLEERRRRDWGLTWPAHVQPFADGLAPIAHRLIVSLRLFVGVVAAADEWAALGVEEAEIARNLPEPGELVGMVVPHRRNVGQ
jgi:hypothetical protein